MGRSTAKLAPVPLQRAPEAELRGLFRAEAELEASLGLVRASIAAARRDYAAKHGLLMLPGVDTLRRLFA